MARELSILELSRLVGELNRLSGFYIDKFYEIEENRFRIRLSRTGEKANLNIEIPYHIIISDLAEVREDATSTTMAVRKRIDGALVRSFSLFNRDRIVRIELGKKGEALNLFFELFGKGNMIITDSNMVILLVYRPHEFADRALRKGSVYAPPKNEAIDLTDRAAIASEFESLRSLKHGETPLGSHLSKRLGIGTAYIRDAIARADLDPKPPVGALKQGALEVIMARISMLIELSSGSGDVVLYLRDNKPVDFAISELIKYNGLEIKRLSSISSAIEQLSSSASRASAPRNLEKLESLKQSIAKQEHSVKRIEAESAQARSAGAFISMNSTLISSAIAYLRAHKDVGEDELGRILNGLRVSKINRKNRTFTIIVDEK